MGQLVSDVTKILDYKDSKKDTETQRQKILTQIAADENTKMNLIKKALSQQRAKYGASGNTGNSMSENAVLKRLRSETAQPYDEKKQENMEKIKNTKTKKPNLVKTWLSKIDDIAG
jgi:ribonuclease HII